MDVTERELLTQELQQRLARVHPEDGDFVQQQIERASRDGEGLDFEHRLQLSDRCIKHVRPGARTSRDSSGELEFQLQSTLNVIPAYAWYAAPSGALVFVNERSADYLGLPKDHPLRFGIDIGGEWDSHIPLLHPDDQEESRRVWATCLHTGSAGEFSQRVRNAEGAYRWFLSRAEPLRASDGTLLYWVGVNLDIEECEQAEQNLQAQEMELRQVLDLTPQLILVFGPNRERLYANRPALDYFGFSLDEWRQRSRDGVVHPDDSELLRASQDRALSTGSPYELEVRVRKADGSYRWFLARFNPVRNDKGEVMRWYAAAADIEDRKRAEQKLQEQEMELRQILDHTPQLAGVFGRNLERLYVNRAALDYFGTTLDEWRQRRVGAEVHPEDSERFRALVDRALLGGSAYELEMRVRGGGENYRWFLARYNPVRDDNGQVRRWYVACTDIEDRKQEEEKLRRENAALREEVDQTSMFEEIVGTSRALKAVLSHISKVAPSDSTVLITGETGTGKELVARAIHRRSARASRAFVSVNCAAIPRELIASELFGHEKGAFTGATQRRIGRFELADGGTIFLDEVGELSPDTQAALLRVLQEREFERLGGNQPIHVNVRVVTATNRNLEAAVSNGSFRQDLLYRLNVFPIEVPSLRDRKDDILMLVEYFVQRYASRAGKNIRSIDKKTVDLLHYYEWPGNIRELQNVIERTVILCSSEVFSVDESWLSKRSSGAASRVQTPAPLKVEADPRSEREIIEAALAESRGRVSGPSGAAARLGLPPSSLDHRIKALKIDKTRFKFR
jgi:PAS domain S-box-containing protein